MPISSLVVLPHHAIAESFCPIASVMPQGFKLDGRQVYLPMIRVGRVLGESPYEKAPIKNVTVSRPGQHWCVSFQVEVG